MSGWLDKRGGLEATKVKITLMSLFSLIKSNTHGISCYAEMEAQVVHTQQSPSEILQE